MARDIYLRLPSMGTRRAGSSEWKSPWLRHLLSVPSRPWRDRAQVRIGSTTPIRAAMSLVSATPRNTPSRLGPIDRPIAHSKDTLKLALSLAPPRSAAAVRQLVAGQRPELIRHGGSPSRCQQRRSPCQSHIQRIRSPETVDRRKEGKACVAPRAAGRILCASAGDCSIGC